VSSIFISHSSHDNSWAERISDWLQDERAQRPQEQRFRSLFLDFDPEDGIQAGERWRDQLYEHLQLCAAVVVLCSEAYAASQWCLAELGVAIASGKLVLPVRIASGTPLPKLLSETQSTALAVIDLEQGTDSGLQRLLKGLEPLSWQSRLRWPPPGEPAGASPFPGLDTFERRHAAVFFGQEQVLRTLRETINQLPQRQSRLLLILGASGCGKSSLLRAGLVPWLAESDQRRWIVVEPFRPGKQPFKWLHQVVSERFKAVGDIAPGVPGVPGVPARTVEQLGDQLEDLRRLIGQQDARVVIPIDQFEELLGRGDDRNPKLAADADAFLTLLAQLLAMEGSQVLILATLRSDFYGQLQLHPSGLHRLAGPPLPLGPMEPAGFRQVIEGPAQRVGLRLEPGLSDALVHDTTTGDALPLLAFTLQELWEGRGDGLTLQQYEAFGRLAGAIQRKADAVLASSGAGEGEITALQEALVEHLIRLTSESQATKQPARRAALPPASLRLVDLFVAARLLVAGKGAGGDQVEIAHEVLLRSWPTLVGWIESGREALLQRLRVRRLAADLNSEAPDRQRRQALEQLAAMAAAGSSEMRAVAKEATVTLTSLLAWGAAPCGNEEKAVIVADADREDAALVLAMIGAEEPLRQCLANPEAPVRLRQRAAESLGLLARRCGKTDPQAIEQRQRIEAELEAWLRSVPLNLLLTDTSGWAEHDARLPLLQGASRGLQLAASADLPLLGSGAGRMVPMLTVTALEEGCGLRICTDVVRIPVWKLPLPREQYLELAIIPSRIYKIGRPARGHHDELYAKALVSSESLVGYKSTDPESEREVNLRKFAFVRYPITQAQWRAVAELSLAENKSLNLDPGIYEPKGLWDAYAQCGEYPVDSVTWEECRAWLKLLNKWLMAQDCWKHFDGKAAAPELVLPSESQWEAACDAWPHMFHFGDILDTSWANYDGGLKYAHHLGRQGLFRRRPVSVGFFGLVNRFGLAEMHGQFWEWCADHWHPNPIGEDWPRNGRAWVEEDPVFKNHNTEQKGWKLLKGGSWFVDPRGCRGSLRRPDGPDLIDTDIGFRPCCNLPANTH
jgi:formylglycine-generating enzyme required for sulfatase activity